MSGDIFEHGRKVRSDIIGKEIVDTVFERSGPIEMDVQKVFTAFSWGEVFDRPGLPKKTRILITIATLAMIGEREPLKHHVRAGMRLGCTQEEIREAILQAGSIAGSVRAILGCRAADEALREKPVLAPATAR
jgi:alkylhydroperoxidase/carboxymuconolactone decarboxylase family protein YurZ